jgi:hypothetical protein
VKFSFVYLFRTLNFIIFYLFLVHDTSGSKILLDYWENRFMPFPPNSLTDLKWFASTFLYIFRDPVGLVPPALAALVFLVGSIFMLTRNKPGFLLLILPIFFTLLASGLQKYPFGGRLLLFAVPMLLIIISEGLSKIIKNPNRVVSVAGILIIIMLFFHPIVSLSHYILKIA